MLLLCVFSHSSPISAAGVDAELIQAPVLDLLQEGECTQLLHHMQPPCLVVVQDVVKCLRAPVKEILILHQVSIITELKEARGDIPGSGDHHGQFAKTSVGVARQSLLGHHKAAASHIDCKAVQGRNNLLQQGPLLLLAGENTAVQGAQRCAIALFLQGRLGIKRHAAGRRLHPVAASSSPHSPGWKTQQSCRDSWWRQWGQPKDEVPSDAMAPVPGAPHHPHFLQMVPPSDTEAKRTAGLWYQKRLTSVRQPRCSLSGGNAKHRLPATTHAAPSASRSSPISQSSVPRAELEGTSTAQHQHRLQRVARAERGRPATRPVFGLARSLCPPSGPTARSARSPAPALSAPSQTYPGFRGSPLRPHFADSRSCRPARPAPPRPAAGPSPQPGAPPRTVRQPVSPPGRAPLPSSAPLLFAPRLTCPPAPLCRPRLGACCRRPLRSLHRLQTSGQRRRASMAGHVPRGAGGSGGAARHGAGWAGPPPSTPRGRAFAVPAVRCVEGWVAVRRAVLSGIRCLLAGAARFEEFSEPPTSPSALAGRFEFHSLPANIRNTKCASEQVVFINTAITTADQI